MEDTNNTEPSREGKSFVEHSINFLQFFSAMTCYSDCTQILKELLSQVCVRLSWTSIEQNLNKVLLHRMTVFRTVKDPTSDK